MSIYKDIAIPPTLSGMCEARDKAVTSIHAVFDAFGRAQADSAMVSRHAFPSEIMGRLGKSEAIKELDRRAWREAFALGGFDRIWDAEARTKFDESLRYNVPEFNQQNLRATLLEYLPQQDMMFRRGAVTLLRRLSGDYRSNAEAAFKLGPRSVVRMWAAPSYSRTHTLQVAYHHHAEVSDLLRIVAVLSGVEFNPGQAIAAVNAVWHDHQDYEAYGLRLVPFRNQNVHVYLSAQLLDRVNGLIAEFYGDRALGAAA